MAEVKERVLLALAMRDKSQLTDTMHAVTEASAEILGVARAGVWRLVTEPSALVCQDLYWRTDGRHTVDDPILAENYPAYFAALGEQRTIPTDQASIDPRTFELSDDYLAPRKIVSMMDVPIWHRGALYGVLCNEHNRLRRWRSDDIAFATNLSDILSLSLEASERREAELHWSAVVDAIGEAVFLLHADGRLEPANVKMRAKIAELGGCGTPEERDRRIEVVDLLGRPMSPENEPTRRAMRGETVAGEVVGFRKRGADTAVYFRVTITPVDGGEEGRHWVGVLGDLSEEVRFAQIKRRFLDDVAHELKTPVAMVKGYAYLLSHDTDLPARHQPPLDAIRRATDRMARLVHGLVDVSGILLGRVVLAWERIHLRDVAQQVGARLAVDVPGLAVQVHETHDVEVVGDRERLELALRELLDTVLNTGGHATGIDFLITREGSWAVVTIRVNGLEFSPDPTEPLMRPPSPGMARGGAGLVPLVFREVVFAHHGQIAVESSVAGTTVRISLPAVDGGA